MFPGKDSFINIHAHKKPVAQNEFVIRNAFLALDAFGAGQLPYAVSVGLHPWYLHKKNVEECVNKLTGIGSLPTVFAIGEIGIDRAIDTPLNKQIEYFEAQLFVAEQLNKPVIIHAVRSYPDFIPYLKKNKVPFIFHGFNGNKQQAAELLKYNCKLSFGKNLLSEKSAEVLKWIPRDAFFLETDTSHINISTVYDAAGNILGLEQAVLKEQLFYTFAQIFHVK